MKHTWFPRNYKLTDGVILKAPLSKGGLWQIYASHNNAKTLIVKATLFEYWKELHLVSAADFHCFLFDDDLYFCLYSSEEYEVACISVIRDFVSADEGLSYAYALKETRKIIPSATLKNGLFVERISRILPMPDELEQIADDVVLGTWLTGGLEISATAMRRMQQVQPCLSGEELKEIIAAANLSKIEKEAKDTALVSREQLNPKCDCSSNPKARFSLPGRHELETFLVEHVIDIVEHPNDYAAMNISFPGAFILQGPPGCGKTYAVDRLVEYLDWPVFYVNSGAIGSSFIHETSKKISQLFQDAINHAPSILVIDEMEAFLSTRSKAAEGNGHHKEEVAEFLRQIPKAVEHKVLVIGMTNMIDSIDPAVRRRGRFDNIIEVSMPSAEEIRQVIEHALSSLPHDEDINLEELSERLAGTPMSDVAYVIRESARLTAKNHLKSITKEIISLAIERANITKKEERRTIGFH